MFMNTTVFKASLVAQWVKNLPAVQDTWVQSLGWKIPWRRAWQPTPVFLLGESSRTEEAGGLQSMGWQGSYTTQDYTTVTVNMPHGYS